MEPASAAESWSSCPFDGTSCPSLPVLQTNKTKTLILENGTWMNAAYILGKTEWMVGWLDG